MYKTRGRLCPQVVAKGVNIAGDECALTARLHIGNHANCSLAGVALFAALFLFFFCDDDAHFEEH